MKKNKLSRVFFIAIACAGIGSTCGSSQQTASTASTGGNSGSVAGSAPFAGDPNIFVKLAKKAVPSVVNISTMSVVKSPYSQGRPDDPYRRFFEDFFGPGGPQGGMPPFGGRPGRSPHSKNLPKATALGTGFVIDSSGLILTNNHVIENADEIKISFTEDPAETPTSAQVVGKDPELDVALLKVDSKREMIPLPMGNSDSLEVGEYVMAVGNPFGQGHSVTHGIISGKGRPLPEFVMSTYLQTDAPINPGNSGGPLVNLKGEMIGMNVAIDARGQNMGYAIPSNAIAYILPQLREKGSVSRGYIGVLIGELSPEIAAQVGVSKEMKAPFVTHIYPGEPADHAGIKPYDVILEFNGKKVLSSADLVGAVTSVPVGQSAPMKISRSGKEKVVSIKVAQRPLGNEKTPVKKEKASPSQMDTGMELETLTPELATKLGITGKAQGVVVTSVEFDGPANKSGLTQGDVIVEVDRKPIADVGSFYSIVKAKKSYLLRVRRAGPMGQEGFAVVVLDLKE